MSHQNLPPVHTRHPQALAAYEATRAQARALLLEPAPQGARAAELLTQAAQDIVLTLWRALAPEELQQASLIFMLGGHGRRDSSFHSDIDLLIEVHDPALLEHEHTVLAIEAWLRAMRASRAKIAHAVRTPAQGWEAMQQDWRTPISLLDARLISQGEQADPGQCVAREAALKHLRADDEGVGFVEQLIQGFRARRDRHGRTVYLLEPDIKSGLGGLRDVHAIHWGSLVRCDKSALAHAIPSWGFEEEQRQKLLQAREWLLSVRHRLHLLQGRQADRLRFEQQEALAHDLFLGRSQPAEALMHQHYHHARQIQRIMERALRRLVRPRLLALEQDTLAEDERFARVGGALALKKDAHLARPADALRALERAQDLGLLLEAQLEQQLEDHVARWGFAQRDDLALQRQLLDLLSSHGAQGATSQRLLELGILAQLIPEFAPLICHVQHDVYHVYTTDVHTMKCVDRARALVHNLPDEACDRWPAFRRIAAHLTRPDLLPLAAFLHDIGKRRGGDHSRKGAALTPQICRRIGLPEDDIDILSTLVREHLILSNTSRRRDISDARVLRDICARIPSLEMLNLLTALTFCDMSTVGPESMNDWRATLLLQLHARLCAYLEAGGSESWEDRKALIKERREQILDQLALIHASPLWSALGEPNHDTLLDALSAFLSDVPLAHLASAPIPTLIRQLLANMCALERDATVTLAEPLDAQDVHELVVATRDSPGTIAKIAGVLSAHHLNILTASITTTSSGMALDVFRIDTPPDLLITLDAARLERVERALKRALDGEEDVEEMLQKRIEQARLPPRHGPQITPIVRAYQDASDHFTVLEVQAPDRLGLLYEIATTLRQHHVSTHFSTLDVMGNKVVDTFYVEDDKGGKLDAEHVEYVRQALLRTIRHSPYLDHPDAQSPREAP